ncbi:hypothetical protein BGX27_001054 [Mortierella sp. AM989]|nr:hypothetical protein BGX27_001054 [Mortierella sp. AM989]
MNNIPPQQQQQQQQQDQQPFFKQESQQPFFKQEPQQESIQLSAPQSYQHFQPLSSYSSQQQQQQPQQQQQSQSSHGQSYSGLQGSSGNLNSFSALPPNPYNLNSHLMGLSMQNGSTSSSSGGLNASSLAPAHNNTGLMSGANSGSTTPSMAYASAPSSPILNNLQYNPSGSTQYSQNSSSLYYQHPSQQQTQQHSNQYSYHGQQQPQHQSQHAVQSMSSSSLTSSFYPTSPPHQHQQQNGSSTPFSSVPSTPLRQQHQPAQQQTQYAPLVPPLSDAQYAQYRQLLGSALSSAASTPYHSNQSTPYSSMPTSPTLEYQQLSDPNMIHKPKRRQVKNACDSTRKIRKKGIKRGPYKRKIPPSQLGSASASTTPVMSHAVLSGPSGYMSEPVTALNSPTQSHMLPFTSSTMNFGYGANSGSSSGYSFQTQAMDSSYVPPPYTTSYSGSSLYSTSYGMNDVLAEGGKRKETKPRQAKTSNKPKHADNHEPPKKKHNKSGKHKKTKHKDQHSHDKGNSHHDKGYQNKNRQDKVHQDKGREEQEAIKSHHGHMVHHHHHKGMGGGIFDAFAADTSCNPARCPPEVPCCSKWGFCGISADHCIDGCQSAFGQCGTDAMTGQDARGQWGHKRHGFDLEERRRALPNQDGRRFRIPPSVPRLPGKDVLVNIAYFPGWTQYRGQGRNNCHQRPYLPSAIPWSSLNYVMFAFVYFDEDNELYPADPSDENLYFEINRLKLQTQTRVMISIGGWSFMHPETRGEEDTRHRFENMIRSPGSRQAFIASCIRFCRFYGFDGIDIDYEYPTYRDREFLTALFREMRQAFDAEGSGLVISLAGASFQEGIQGYELEKVSMYTDFIMIMTYDLYGSYDSSRLVNIHTALVQMPTETHGGHSVQGAVELYIDNGVPRSKIVVGLALYGKTFTLQNPGDVRPGFARFTTGGDPTSCIETQGDMAYNEIANLIHPGGREQGPVQPLWDASGKAFYFVYGDRRDNWVGYDDRPSLDIKLQLVTELDLAGVMWWSLDQDLDATSQEAAFYKKHKLRPRGEASSDVIEATSVSSAEDKKDQPQPMDATEAQVPLLAADLLQETYSKVHLHPRGIQNFAPMACPPLAAPPAWMATIFRDGLGKPGLVPYVASKRRRCPAVVRYPHFLPDTPVGNVVLKRCHGAANCPESWQAFTCRPEGWSTGSSCYAKAALSPSLYFYGELKLVRISARDRNAPVSGVGPSRASYKMSAQIGSKRPQYITQYIKLTKMRKLVEKIDRKRKLSGDKVKLVLKAKKKKGSKKRKMAWHKRSIQRR